MTLLSLTPREDALFKVHLPYELNQLDSSFVIATSPAATDIAKLIRLMAIDCFYLHARNLIEFHRGKEVDPTNHRSRRSGSRRSRSRIRTLRTVVTPWRQADSTMVRNRRHVLPQTL